MGILGAAIGLVLVLQATVEVETPAAYVISRDATLRVGVLADGTTHVANLPDSEGWVLVIGKDPPRTQVELAPGEGASVRPGLPPLGPLPIRRLEAAEARLRTGARRDLLRRAIIQLHARRDVLDAWLSLVQTWWEAVEWQQREQRVRAALEPFVGPRAR